MAHLKLFPTNIGIYEVENASTLNEDLLKVDGLTDNKYNFRLYNDIWNIRHDVPAIKTLHDLFLTNAATFANECHPEFEYKPEFFHMEEGWCDSRLANQDLRMHNHRSSHLSGVYYCQVTPTSGDLEFIDPRANLGLVSLDSHKHYNAYRHRPESGQMLIFPGWLLHYVHSNLSGIPRVVFVTNFKLKEEFQFKGERHKPNEVTMK
jgi:uncharacterized protein (TIGR02466 family)